MRLAVVVPDKKNVLLKIKKEIHIYFPLNIDDKRTYIPPNQRALKVISQ